MHQNEYNAATVAKLGQVGGPKDLSPAQTKLNELKSAQSFSHELFETLEAKLELILAPQDPTGSGTEGCPRAIPPSPICRDLQDRCDDSHTLNRRLQSLIDHLTI